MKEEDPKITLFNRQRALTVDVRSLRKFLVELAARLAPSHRFSVVLISDEKMRRYNREYASKDKATDVLSFPSGGNPFADPEMEGYLGDILISVESAERQRQVALDEELKCLALHGLLHLLGYDHETDQGEMAALERSLRGELKLSST